LVLIQKGLRIFKLILKLLNINYVDRIGAISKTT
jgi:hypothetical protein